MNYNFYFTHLLHVVEAMMVEDVIVEVVEEVEVEVEDVMVVEVEVEEEVVMVVEVDVKNSETLNIAEKRYVFY